MKSCAVIATDAANLATEVHDRIPVVRDDADYVDWLTGEELPL